MLAILRGRQTPLSAYELLSELRAVNPKAAAPTVYRALASLIESGRAHRLESLNAYIACRSADPDNASVLSICDGCGAVEENAAPELVKDLSDVVAGTGFSPNRHVIEVHGKCATCGAESGGF